MQVALLQTPIAPLDLTHTGGMEVVELSELEGLRQRGVQTRLYAARVTGQKEGICQLADWGSQGRLSKFWYYYNFAHCARRADVFHGHYTTALALTHPSKSLIHFHGVAVQELPLYRYFAQRCHQAHFAFCSHFIADQFVERYPRVPAERLHVIWNGVDVDRFRPSPEGRPPGGKVKIIFYAGWTPKKGIYELLEAAALLGSRRDDFELYLGGSAFSHYRGPDSERIDRQVRERAASLACVQIIGHLRHEELPSLLRTMDLGAVPSLWEPFGLVAVEMMAAGLPVVASRVGGLPESVMHEETGLLVESGQPVRLAQALETLIDNAALRRQMGEAARRRVERYFTWDRHVDQLMEIYEQIIRQNYRKR